MWKLLYHLLKKWFFIFVILLLLIPYVKALGTLQKNDYLEIESGQSAEFDILFWDSQPIEIELEEKNVPKNWIIIIEPKKFIVDDAVTSPEVVSLQDRYVNALPVKIVAIPQEGEKPGIYEIVLNMVAGESDEGISFFQEKNFNFKVRILGKTPEQEKSVIETINNSLSETGKLLIPTKELEKISSISTRVIFWAIIVILTLLICWFIYKR